MADSGDILIDIREVEKDYRGLRPLRVRRLEVRAGESVALMGFDQAAAEVFVNLVTAATVPDLGEVRAFGQLTTAIDNADDWLRSLDRFGIISDRAVVIDNLSVEDNLTMPVTMALHDIPAPVQTSIRTLANEVGLGSQCLKQPVASLDAAARLRLRLGRAIAPGPRILLAEHPNASVGEGDLSAFGADYARIVAQRSLTSVVVTADRNFAEQVASRVLVLRPATGELTPLAGWRRWFL